MSKQQNPADCREFNKSVGRKESDCDQQKEDMTQAHIARKTGYSRSMISRFLKEAKRQGVVEIRVHHPLALCEAPSMLSELLEPSAIALNYPTADAGR